MKREIEFMGKRVDNGEWVYGLLIEENDNCYIFKNYGVRPEGYSYLKSGGATVGFYVEVIPETVAQFLFISNGHRFYEDCIIRREKSDQLWVIIWNEEINAFSCLTDYEYRMLSDPDSKLFVLSNHSAVNYTWLSKNGFYPIGQIIENHKLISAQ